LDQAYVRFKLRDQQDACLRATCMQKKLLFQSMPAPRMAGFILSKNR